LSDIDTEKDDDAKKERESEREREREREYVLSLPSLSRLSLKFLRSFTKTNMCSMFMQESVHTHRDDPDMVCIICMYVCTYVCMC